MKNKRIKRTAGIVMAMAAVLMTVPAKGTAIDGIMITDEIKIIERTYIKQDKPSENYFGYVKGSIPILISAPHGAMHYRSRQSRWKQRDAYTSSLAIQLGRMTGAHVLYVNRTAPEDANDDADCRYKDFLTKVVKENGIRFVLDIHGASRGEPFKVDFGVIDRGNASCPSFISTIEKAFTDFDDNIFNKRFCAKGPATVTRFVHDTLGVESAQIEINAIYRLRGAKEEDVLNLMQRLQTMISHINETIAEQQAPHHHV